jgi:hypothetical protein
MTNPKSKPAVLELINGAMDALRNKEELDMRTPMGQAQEVMRLCTSKHQFFQRVFNSIIREKETMEELFNRDQPAYCRIFWHSMNLFRENVVLKKIPLDTFKNYTLSFDDGNTIQYFGAGVVTVLDLVRERKKLMSPKINLGAIKFIVDDMSNIFSKENGRCDMQRVLRNQIYFESEEQKGEFQSIVYVQKGTTTFSGAYGTYEYDGEEREFLYTLPPKSFPTGAKVRHSALVNHPISFLKRKFKNAIYKELFGDFGVDVEVTEEYSKDGSNDYIDAVNFDIPMSRETKLIGDDSDKLSKLVSNCSALLD